MGTAWTLASIPDLSGKVAVVTGANSGLGLETARELARAGAHVVLGCRDPSRAEAAFDSIRDGNPRSSVTGLLLDLASLQSVRGFADAFRQGHDRLDVLVNNAGVMVAPYGTTDDGFEVHLGTNHLGHFALTGLLMDRLIETSGSRVVTVSSLAHRVGRMDFADLSFEQGATYSAFGAYARSKLANLLFTYELQRRLVGRETIAVAAHPGGAVTDLGRHMGERRLYRMLRPVMEAVSQSASRGALPILRAATDPHARGAEYYGPSGAFGLRGSPVLTRASRNACDEEMATRLWEISEKLTGTEYEF